MEVELDAAKDTIEKLLMDVTEREKDYARTLSRLESRLEQTMKESSDAKTQEALLKEQMERLELAMESERNNVNRLSLELDRSKLENLTAEGLLKTRHSEILDQLNEKLARTLKKLEDSESRSSRTIRELQENERQ
jgi:hypothetical protein